jgi:hypothetical protein
MNLLMNLRMERWQRLRLLSASLIGCVVIAANAFSADVRVELSGNDEIPAVTTSALGSGMITINDDKTVSGSVTTTGVTGTMAHIHMAPAGKNGPPIITLTKTSATEWTVPPGALLTDEQFANFKAGNLYINVHSAAYPSGEIRGQLQP